MKLKKKMFLPLLFVAVISFNNCKKDSKNVANLDFFTPVNVDFSINMDLPLYADLNFPNGYVYEKNQGYKQRGVVVYNTGFSGPDQYVAFDRSCPYKVDSSCSYVSVDSSTLYFRCGQFTGVGGKFSPCCNSKFLASTGYQLEGLADRPLRQYYVFQSGKTLYVRNTPF
ncbi:MAG: hypothetical protein K9H61_06230 [Bacteroidia bacterium]|nr:hypothetical protein [Bacteroidia bacterium]MCF8426299.1 hypothetical protein [Bacteroidia bacterium]MCF8446575.1 hypothetical protein [Bacteroidia bacterium]